MLHAEKKAVVPAQWVRDVADHWLEPATSVRKSEAPHKHATIVPWSFRGKRAAELRNAAISSGPQKSYDLNWRAAVLGFHTRVVLAAQAASRHGDCRREVQPKANPKAF
jgi:hypothetical protein